jgi:nicotinic acid phosphoribosyltransferase
MAYAYWKSGRVKDTAVFDLFFRQNPFGGEFTIFAGLGECLKFLQNFHYSDSGKGSVSYLPSVNYEGGVVLTEDNRR